MSAALTTLPPLESLAKPTSSSYWPSTIRMATAATRPACTSAEMNRTSDPSRSSPRAAMTTPTSTVKVNMATAGSTPPPSAPILSAATRARALVAVMTSSVDEAMSEPTRTVTEPA
jgi:hypothetical protein